MLWIQIWKPNSAISVQMDNTPPVFANLQITGGLGSYYNDEVLTCSVTVSDPNEVLSPSYIWTAGATVLGTSDVLDLATTTLLPTDPLTCTVNANDSHGGTANDALTVWWRIALQIRRRSLSLGASGAVVPEETDDLICSASGGTDPDGEANSLTYSWTSDLGASVSGDTVPSSQTQLSESWTCEVESTAGALSSIGTASVTVDSGWAGERPDHKLWSDRTLWAKINLFATLPMLVHFWMERSSLMERFNPG